jgi:hypothetical protein
MARTKKGTKEQPVEQVLWAAEDKQRQAVISGEVS